MINLRKDLIKIISIVLILIPSVSFSAPLFYPGETLEPGCLPTNPDCTVSTSTSIWSLNGTSATYLVGSVGIGTSTPASMLDIYGTSSAPTADIFGVSSSSNARLFTITSTGNVGIGSTTPGSLLSVMASGTSITSPFVSFATTSTIFSVLTNGNVGIGVSNPDSIFEVAHNVTNWMAASSSEQNAWNSVTYGNGLFVAVAQDGTNRVMTSPDGLTWTARSDSVSSNWQSVVYGSGLFVAVANSPDGYNQVITSPDGITWTAQAAAENSYWVSVTYGSSTYVAVASAVRLGGTHRVMTSPNGVTWTAQTEAETNQWRSVTYGNGIFVAVAANGIHRVMYSSDGATWTAATSSEANSWYSVTYGNGIFVAVAQSGTYRVMTSPDGITWTAQTAAEANQWRSVTYGNGMFVAVANTGTNRIMTSPNGITWTAKAAPEANSWNSVAYGNGTYVAVSTGGTSRVMALPEKTKLFTVGNDGAVTIASSTTIGGLASISGLITIGGTATIGSSTIIAGNLGVGTSTAGAKLDVYNSSSNNNVLRLYSSSNSNLFDVTNSGVVTVSNLSSVIGGFVRATATGTLYTTSSALPLYWLKEPEVVASTSVPYAANYGTWDGNNFWATDYTNHSISKISSAGTLLDTYYLGVNLLPIHAVFDGTNLWVASADTYGHLIRFNPTSATTTGDFIMNPSNVGDGGVQSVIWDGTNIWVGVAEAGPGPGFVARVNPSTGVAEASTTGQTNVNGLIFTNEGGTEYIWAANSGFISKINASDLTYSTTTSGATGYRLTTDGTYIYVANWDNNGTINKYLAQTGALLTTWTAGYRLNAIAYDGQYIWTVGDDHAVTIHDPSTGSIIKTISNGGKCDVVFDGEYMWTVDNEIVRKIYIGSSLYDLKLTNSLSVLNSSSTSVFFSASSTTNNYIMGNLGIGTSTPSTNLQVQGGLRLTGSFFDSTNASGTSGMILQSTGTSTLWTDPSNISKSGYSWTAQNAAQANSWNSVAYGNGTFVAVSGGGTNRVMISSDGINWATSTAAEANSWQSVTYGNGLFVAVSIGGSHRVMTSPDGVTWTAQTAAEANVWYSVTYGNGLFIAVSQGGTNRIMTSPDGVTWTAQAAPETASWGSIIYGNGKFVALSDSGNIMLSSDGINWATSTASGSGWWHSVTYGNGLFVAVGEGATNYVMTSPDGVTWTTRTPSRVTSWYSVTYGNGLFVAVDYSNGFIMTSPDGINWTNRAPAASGAWNSVTYGNGMFVIVGYLGAQRVMTSGKPELNFISTKNIYQGGMNIFGNVGIGTTTPSANLTISGTPTSTLLRLVGFGSGSLSSDASGNVIISSDERLKDIQGSYDKGLEDIMKINPISYKWKPETGYDASNTYTGFSAQNMQLAIPEAVGINGAGYLTLSDRPIIAALVNSIKQIGSFISKIEGGIAYLKNIVIEKLTIGSNASPAGITMYDEVTGEPYCIKIKLGAMINEAGVCTISSISTTTISIDTSTTTPDTSATTTSIDISTTTPIDTSTTTIPIDTSTTTPDTSATTTSIDISTTTPTDTSTTTPIDTSTTTP